MADLDYIIEILLKARDEASPKIDALKAKLDALKATQDAEGAERDLGRAVDDSGRKAEDSRRKHEGLTREHEKGARAATDAKRSVKDLGDTYDDSTQSTTAHTKAQSDFQKALGKTREDADDTGKAVKRLDNKMAELTERHEDLQKATPKTTEDFQSQKSGLEAVARSIDNVASRYEGLSKRRGEAAAGSARLEAIEARAEAEQLRRNERLAQHPISLDAQQQAIDTRRRARDAESARETEINISKMSSLWDDFLKKKSSGSLTEEQTRRDAKDLASGWNTVAREVRKAGGEAEQYGLLADKAVKIAKNAKLESTGGFLNQFKSPSFGNAVEYLDAKFGDLGLRISGVSSFLRGFFDLAKIGFSQQLLTGVASLAGGLFSLASAAGQAGAALAGAFVSGLGQAIPMISIVIASVERFKQILQAVSVASQAEQQHFYNPTEKQVTQLQNINQLINSQQQLSNSAIQLFQAQERVRDSQIALTEARYTAQRQITELALAEKNARLEAEGANLSLIESRRQLAIATEKGNLAGIQQAELGVKQAELQKRSAEYAVPKAEREARLARQRGVSGAPSVISATEGLEGARVAVLQARQAGEAAQRQEQITRLQQQARSSKETQFESQLKFLKKGMSPTELGLTEALIGIEKELKSSDSPLKKITDYFVEPFTDAVQRIRGLLKTSSFLEPIDNLAKAMGDGLKRLEKATYGERGTSFFETMAKDAAKNIPIVVEAIEHLMHIFELVAEAADPAFTRLSKAWDRFWGKLDSKYSSPQGFRDLERFFDKSAEYAEKLGRLGTAVFDLFKELGHNAAPQGLKTVESLTENIKNATDWVQSHGPEVTKFFKEAREGLEVIGSMLFGIGKSIIQVFSLTSLTAFNGVLQQVVLPGLRNVVTIFGFITTKILGIVHLLGGFGSTILEIVGTVGIFLLAVLKIYEAFQKIKKAWLEFMAVFDASALINPWTAVALAVGGVIAVISQLGENQKKVKVTTEEATQALENQANAIRTIKGLNDEFKSTKLGVEEAGLQVTTSRQALSRAKREGPAQGESKQEYAIRLQQDEQQVRRSELSYSERRKEFEQLPAQQKETSKKSLRESAKDLETYQQRVKSLSELVKEDRHTLELAAPEYKGEIQAHLRQEEKELAEAKEGLTHATKKQAEATKQSNELISQSFQQTSKDAPKFSEAYQEAYRRFGEAVAHGEDAAGKGMSKIRQLVDESLKKYGVTPAEISGASSTVVIRNKNGTPREEVPTYTPKYAAGAYVSARSGGQHAIVAESGHDEAILSTDPRHAVRSRQILGRYFSNAPHMAQGGPVGYESPFHSQVQWGRSDQGVDVNLTPGSPLTAIGESLVRGIIPNWYNGQPFIWAELLNGIDKGKDYYFAEQINRLAKVGQVLKEGQPLAYYAPTGTGLEAGWATASGQTLAQATTGYREGEATTAGKAFTSFVKNLVAGRTVASEIGEATKRITEPVVKGGGQIGAVAQRGLGIATQAANIYLEKHMATAARAQGNNIPAGKLGPPNKLLFARTLAGLTGLPVRFLGAWINHEQGASTVEGGNNWLNIETGIKGGSGPYGATAKWVERHTAPQAAQIEAEWLRSNLPQLLRAKSASEAVQILEGSGYAESHYNYESPSQFLSAYAGGGIVGSHLRRMAIRHLRRKVLRFAEGGRAPWGGRPVPIVAHEGERIVNPAQWGETARLAGTTPSGLDSHLGYDSRPRQHFAAGGKVAPLGLPGIPGALEISNAELGNISTVVRLIKVISEAFEKIGNLKKPETYKTEIIGFFENVSKVFESLNEGREFFKNKLQRKLVGKEYSTGSDGNLIKGSGGEVKIAEDLLTQLKEENSYLGKEVKLLQDSKKSIVADMKKAKSKTAKSLYQAEFNELIKKEKELGELLTQNLEARYQAQVQILQNKITETSNSYQTSSRALSAEFTQQQALGNAGKVENIEKSIASLASGQIVTVEKLLTEAEAIGNRELEASLKQELTSLKETIANATIEQINVAQNLIQRELGLAESKASRLSTKAKIATEKGEYGRAGEFEKQFLTAKNAGLEKAKEEDTKLLDKALREGNTEAVVKLTEEINKATSEIEENNMALKENATVTRELVINQIQATGQFRSGIYGSISQGLEILGKTTGFTNVSGLIGAAKGRETALGTERSELEQQASGMGLGVEGMTPSQLLTFLGSPEGQAKLAAIESKEDKAEKEQLYKLIQALETNSVNTLKNAEELAHLNGQLNQPQSWSTAASQLFRTSFFSGMGGLLPQYSSALPPGARPTEMPVFGAGTPGAPTMGGTHIGQINLTHPVEKLDPQLFGEELSYHIATTPPAV